MKIPEFVGRDRPADLIFETPSSQGHASRIREQKAVKVVSKQFMAPFPHDDGYFDSSKALSYVIGKQDTSAHAIIANSETPDGRCRVVLKCNTGFRRTQAIKAEQ